MGEWTEKDDGRGGTWSFPPTAVPDDLTAELTAAEKRYGSLFATWTATEAKLAAAEARVAQLEEENEQLLRALTEVRIKYDTGYGVDWTGTQQYAPRATPTAEPGDE